MSTALIPLSKGKKSLVSFGAIMLTVAVACYGLALMTLVPPILQRLDGMSYAGLVGLCISLGITLMSPIGGKLGDIFGRKAVVVIAGLVNLICDPKLTNEFVGYMKDMNIPGAMPYPGISASASEDFASIADKIPGTFMYLSAGFLDDRGGAPAHNPKVMFNEDVCPIGASSYAHCATEWLKNNK